MNATRHLDADEIVERVFPADDRPVAVPEHLATCAECQERVANLREAWLLDRGAVSGAVDDLPSGFWEAQTAATMAAVRTQAAAPEVRVFPARARGILRHPVMAFSSLAVYSVAYIFPSVTPSSPSRAWRPRCFSSAVFRSCVPARRRPPCRRRRSSPWKRHRFS